MEPAWGGSRNLLAGVWTWKWWRREHLGGPWNLERRMMPFFVGFLGCTPYTMQAWTREKMGNLAGPIKPPPPPPPQYPPQHEASHYSYIIIILLSMSELRPSCEPLNSDTVNSKLWSSLSEVFHTRALPATSNRLWQNNTCSVHSLKDSFQVHSSGYFPDQHWSNSFSSQLLVHTQEVDFNHQADTGGKGNTVRSHKPYRLIFQTPLFRGSFCRADQHKKDRCSESTARERSRPDACILELLL